MFIQSIALAGKHLACSSLLSRTTIFILSCSISKLASRDRTSYAATTATSSKQDDTPKCAAVRGSNRVWSPFYYWPSFPLRSTRANFNRDSKNTWTPASRLDTSLSWSKHCRISSTTGPKHHQQRWSSSDSEAGFHQGTNAGYMTTDQGHRETV